MKNLKRFFAAILAVAMLSATSVTAFAADNNQDRELPTPVSVSDDDYGIMPLSTYEHMVGATWRNITAAHGGFHGGNFAIHVLLWNGALHQVDVMYVNSSGSEIKTEYNVTGITDSKVLSSTIPAGTANILVRIVPRAAFIQEHRYHVEFTF